MSAPRAEHTRSPLIKCHPWQEVCCWACPPACLTSLISFFFFFNHLNSISFSLECPLPQVLNRCVAQMHTCSSVLMMCCVNSLTLHHHRPHVKQISTGEKKNIWKLMRQFLWMRAYTQDAPLHEKWCMCIRVLLKSGLCRAPEGALWPTAPTSDAESGNLVLVSNSSQGTCG